MAQVRAAVCCIMCDAVHTVHASVTIVFIAGSMEGSLRRVMLPCVGNCHKRQCSLTFLGYQPSDWEEEWRTNAEEYQQHACTTMLAQKDLVDAWMEPMNATFSASAAATLPAMQNTKVKAFLTRLTHSFACLCCAVPPWSAGWNQHL